MVKLLELGDHYVSDFIKGSEDYEGRRKYSLDLVLDETLGAPRLLETAPPNSMWGKYWYRSGINASMTNHLREIVTEITGRIRINPNDIWLDIACNDGTLLKAVPNEMKKVGIDPAEDSYHQESSQVAEVVQDYFSYDAWKRLSVADKKAKVITCIAMFYDLDDPHTFVKDLYKVLADDGILVIQMSYTPLMIKQMAFDNICHEHVYYYDLKSIKKLFSMHGFRIVDCSLNDANGGSFRVYFQKETAKKEHFASAPLRDVCDFRVDSLLHFEKLENDIADPETWKNFGQKLNNLREEVNGFIKEQIQAGKKVYGYGASTKGNTLLQYFGLNHELVTAIAERSPYKFGLKTIGTDIPIISEEEMRKSHPDFLLILPWHFIYEFEQREQDYFKKGGAFIVPCPAFKIIPG